MIGQGAKNFKMGHVTMSMPLLGIGGNLMCLDWHLAGSNCFPNLKCAASSVPNTGQSPIYKCHVTQTTPFSGMFCHPLAIGLAMTDISTKFELSNSTRYEERKGMQM